MATIRDMMFEAVKLHQAGNLPQAEQLYREVLRLDPKQGDALNLLGTLANQVGKPEAALDYIRRALVVQPAEPEFHANLAAASKAAGDLAGAITHYREALRLKPEAVSPRVHLCDALMEQGSLDEALTLCLEALRLDRDSALAWCVLGELVGHGKHTFADADIRHMQALLAPGRLGAHDASIVYFTLAAYWEKGGDYDEAFRCYRQANDLKGEVYRRSRQVFDKSKHLELIDSLIDVCTPDFFQRTQDFGADTEVPVFVVGMVRSGTSLVEQILASHPQVFGAGELKDIDQIATELPQRLRSSAAYPKCLTGIDPAAVRTLAFSYLQRLAHTSGAARRVVDKMPHNYLHLGLIALLFPRARIVHCRRDTMDVCASAYFQNFKWLPYAASMEDIAFYHSHYERLMAHWRRVLPLRVHEVVYEEMVANQEAVSRDLVAFCGLDWDDRCLAFYKSARPVQTASKLQVRQPIYTRSVARWKRFEAYLEPLRDALAKPEIVTRPSNRKEADLPGEHGSRPDWKSWLKQAEELFDQKQLDEAVNLAEQVLRHNPACALAHQVLGLVATDRGQPQEALARLARALALQPDLVPSHNGLGRCCAMLGQLDRALDHFNMALFLQPNNATVHFNRASVWLKQGRYRDGLLEYEWRWNSGQVVRPKIPRPCWDGSPLDGRAILIHTEQGLGDVLQFVRFLPEVQRRGGRIVFGCQKALQPLLRPLTCVDEWFPVDEPGPITFQVCAPLLSLAYLLGIDETNIPAAVPYLPVDPDRREQWRPRIENLPGFKVGLCWQGSPTHKGDIHRSFPLAQLAPLAALPGVTRVSLQHGAGEEQIEPNRARLPLQVFAGVDRDGAFLDKAALVQHLDLVITCDTAIAHLAGALGRPVWVLLSVASDWRWLVGRADSPWYPTMRLFRQRTLGDWAGVVAEVVVALEAEIAASRRTDGEPGASATGATPSGR